MFLNDIGQPSILDSRKTYGPWDQHNGPMILTSAAFEEYSGHPNKDWSGQIFGSANNVARFQKTNSTETYKYEVLRPNESTEFEYNNIKHHLTLIPEGRGTYLYYLENKWETTLIADKLSGYLDFIPNAGPGFHRALGNGIDAMYIDNLCYISEEDWAPAQRENLYVLVQLIRPKHLFGLREDKLPSSLLDLCAQKDMCIT